MAEVVWVKEAMRQIEGIRAYTAVFDPESADRLAKRLFKAGG
jgi:plasmid stabilization system protein ParE